MNIKCTTVSFVLVTAALCGCSVSLCASVGKTFANVVCKCDGTGQCYCKLFTLTVAT